METAFAAANVPASPSLVLAIQNASRTAAQRKDAHVIATAVGAKAGVIVTHNVKDFDGEILASQGLIKQTPDAFLFGLLVANETSVLHGVRAHRASMRRTAPTRDEYLKQLAGPKVRVPRFARALRSGRLEKAI